MRGVKIGQKQTKSSAAKGMVVFEMSSKKVTKDPVAA